MPTLCSETLARGTLDNLEERPRLRVLIYTTLFPNSVQPIHGHFILERMRHLIPYVDITVIAPVPYSIPINIKAKWSEFAAVPHTERFRGFDVSHPRYLVIPKIGMASHGISMLTGSLAQAWKQLRTIDFDLIDAHYVYPDGLAATILGKLFNKPVVVSARGTDINLFPQFKVIRPLVRTVLKHANRLIAVSQSLKDVMVDLGTPSDKITVIGNGVDAVKFSSQPASVARQVLGLPSDRSIILSVGHLNENKGFHILIEALARLRSRRPDLLLVIVGEGEYRSHLERSIQALGLQDSVRLVGARLHEELATWYSAADIFCLASSREGCANVLLEAMSCARPVIATRVGGAPEIVVSDSLGSLVERTPESFERAIDHALQLQWDRDLILAHARSLGWDKVAVKVLSVYSEVLAQRKDCSALLNVEQLPSTHNARHSK